MVFSTCKKYRAMMKSALDHELNEPGQSELDAHISRCALCRREYERLIRTAEMIRRAAPRLDDALRERMSSAVLRAIREDECSAKTEILPLPRRILRYRNGIAAAAAGLVIVTVLVYGGIFNNIQHSVDIQNDDKLALTTAASGLSVENPGSTTMQASPENEIIVPDLSLYENSFSDSYNSEKAAGSRDTCAVDGDVMVPEQEQIEYSADNCCRDEGDYSYEAASPVYDAADIMKANAEANNEMFSKTQLYSSFPPYDPYPLKRYREIFPFKLFGLTAE